MAQELALRFQAQHARRCTGGDDQRLGRKGLLARRDLERPSLRKSAAETAAEAPKLRAETLRLFPHILNQIRTQDAVGKTREILDHRGKGELPSRLVTVDDQRLQIRASRINGRG